MALPHKGEWQVIANYFDIIKYHHKKFTVHTPSTKHAIASQVSNVGDNNKYQTRTSFLTYFEVHTKMQKPSATLHQTESPLGFINIM